MTGSRFCLHYHSSFAVTTLSIKVEKCPICGIGKDPKSLLNPVLPITGSAFWNHDNNLRAPLKINRQPTSYRWRHVTT